MLRDNMGFNYALSKSSTVKESRNVKLSVEKLYVAKAVWSVLAMMIWTSFCPVMEITVLAMQANAMICRDSLNVNS